MEAERAGGAAQASAILWAVVLLGGLVLFLLVPASPSTIRAFNVANALVVAVAVLLLVPIARALAPVMTPMPAWIGPALLVAAAAAGIARGVVPLTSMGAYAVTHVAGALLGAWLVGLGAAAWRSGVWDAPVAALAAIAGLAYVGTFVLGALSATGNVDLFGPGLRAGEIVGVLTLALPAWAWVAGRALRAPPTRAP